MGEGPKSVKGQLNWGPGNVAFIAVRMLDGNMPSWRFFSGDRCAKRSAPFIGEGKSKHGSAIDELD